MNPSILSLLLLAVLTAAQAPALELQGRLDRSKEPLTLITDNHVRWRLKPASTGAARDLAKLSHGDYLGASVSDEANGGQWMLREIHFVGLVRLLGVWIGQDRTVMNITSFSQLSFYDHENSPLNRQIDYAYTLAPDDGLRWTLFIVKDGHVLTGRLWFEAAGLVIELSNEAGKKQIFHFTPATQGLPARAS